MKYRYELTVSSAPHIHSPVTTRTIMQDVIIALLPALLGSIWFFGFRALTVTVVSVAACVFFQWGWGRLLKRDWEDLSAVVTGMLLAFSCPVTIPYWAVILGALFAIILAKMLFGGIGRNIFNPALAGRTLLFASPVLAEDWVQAGFSHRAPVFGGADIVTAATPLAALARNTLPECSLAELLLGRTGGCLGETSALLLLIGFAYLLRRRVISVRIPLSYLLTVAILTFLFPRGNGRILWMLAQVLSGGLMLGAIFMATDYVTSPVTRLGQMVYGIGCGVITVLIRYFGGGEGVAWAILGMNACVVLLDRIGRPAKFGTPRKEIPEE